MNVTVFHFRVYNGLMGKEIKTIENEFFTYTGEVKRNPSQNGEEYIPDGRGKIIYRNDDYFFEYEGQFAEGIEEGIGTLVTSDGVYSGRFAKGAPEGEGKMRYRDNGCFFEGDICEGLFEGGFAEGQGKLYYADGSIYEGNFKGGFPMGRGKLTYYDKSIYEGEFDNKPNGKGRLTTSEGAVSEGFFEEGEFMGEDAKEG